MPGRKLVLAPDEAVGPGAVGSSGRQTIIKIGKSDMHELTNSAVDTEFGVGSFDELKIAEEAPVVALLLFSWLSWIFSPRPPPPPPPPLQSARRLASQRIVRCWASVAAAQTRTKKTHWRKSFKEEIGEAVEGAGRDSMWIIVK